MNVFDMSTGSLYALLALASCVYLLKGFEFRLGSLLKAIVAVQILGDLIFFPLLQELPVYGYIKGLTAGDRFYPLLIVMASVFAMDIGSSSFVKRSRMRRTTYSPSSRGTQPEEQGATAGAALKGRIQKLRTGLNPEFASRIGHSFIVFAVISKFAELLAAGFLSGSWSFTAILSSQPEAFVGLNYLDVASLLLFPIGLGLLVMSKKSRPHTSALLAMMAFSVFSPWKADAVKMLLIYILFISHFGFKELRPVLFSRKSALAFLAIVIVFSVKAQYRFTGEANSDVGSLVTGFWGTTSSRLMGGTFQTFCDVVGSVKSGTPLMGGAYNAQTFYIWVPKMIWPNKPRFAAERLYDYLDMVPGLDEPYGSSFAVSVFGTFYVDFGALGSVLCSFAMGALIACGENFLAKLRSEPSQMTKVFYLSVSSIWLNSVYALSEGGLPPTVSELIGGVLPIILIFACMNLAGQDFSAFERRPA
jgi:hypothetical protein